MKELKKLYAYEVFYFYPSPYRDEFFNIGFFVRNEQGQERFMCLKERHLKKLCAFYKVDEKILKFHLKGIENEREEKNFYDGEVGFKMELVRSDKELSERAKELYQKHIGYKF